MHQFLLLICNAIVCINTLDVLAFTTGPTQLSNRRLISQSSANPSLNKLTPPPIQPSSTSNLFFSGTTNDQKFQSIIENSSDDTVQLLRNELKSRLLSAVDEYNTMRVLEEEAAAATKAKEEETNKEDRGYVIRLLHRIVRKISRSKKKTTSNNNQDDTTKQLTQSKGILSSDSFRQETLNVGRSGQAVIELAEQLSLLNPTPIPTLGFKHYKVDDTSATTNQSSSTQSSKLNGNWKLRFTTASDASFPKSTKRGVTTTSQVINAEKGTFTNAIQFEKGKLNGFEVVVQGIPLSDTDIGLSFKKVNILRKSRWPRLFGKITIRLPSRLIRLLASKNKKVDDTNNNGGEDGSSRRGPYLRLKYVDDDLRMHTTDSGNWFIQTRL